MKRLACVLVACLLAPNALAQGDVGATGEALAAAFNKRDVDAIMRLIDAEATTRRVVKDLGLSNADRDGVGRGLPKALRTNVEIGVRSIEGAKGSAKYLRAGARDGKPYALVRLDLGDNGTDYVEYYLTAAGKVEDWYMHSMATLYSSSAKLSLATMLKTDSMLFALFGSRTSGAADIKPFTALRERLQAQDFAGAYRALEALPEGFRRTREWALMRVHYGGRIDEATHRAALRYLAQNFGNDAEVQFMLVDHYFFEKQFDRALESVRGLERAVGGEDAASANLKGGILIEARRFDEAASTCRRGMALEVDHKPAYWCLVTAGLASKNGRIAVEGLKAYEKAFSVEFDLVKLGNQDPYREISRTPEFQAWAKSRR